VVIGGLFGLIVVIFVIALAVSIGTGIWKATVLRRGGLNPLIAQEQLQARVNQALTTGPPAAGGAPGTSKEDRLSEVMDLHARGIISDDELAAARAAIISD
jgi:hypothetical protein